MLFYVTETLIPGSSSYVLDLQISSSLTPNILALSPQNKLKLSFFGILTYPDTIIPFPDTIH